MNDSVFGEAPDAEHKPCIKIIWPTRPLNAIEGELLGAMGEALSLEEHRVPVIFIGEDEKNAEPYEAIYGVPFTVADAMALQEIVRGDVIELYRRQLIIARECDGAMPDYLLRCEAEGVEPILKATP